MAKVYRVLPFELGGLRFALPAAHVLRVLPTLPHQPLPAAPAVIRGLALLQGQLVPVIDLARRLGLPTPAFGLWSHCIWLRSTQRELLLPVERSAPVRELAGELHALDRLQASDSPLAGVLQAEDGLLLLHDVEALLSAADEQALAQALAQYAQH
ncbi:chemotaxis protein CheW [Chitinimonas taiwanensis]|uniref:chemotaxis protein CheW n=1 Tax=Chitinimonas taiwanensis TaxID=240412 RepID=UPI0035B1A9F9